MNIDDSAKDPPIEPQAYLSGVKVVDIGDLRVARGKTRRPHSACRHVRLVYDPAERRVWCSDCAHDVEAFDAFCLLVERFSSAVDRIRSDRESLNEAIAFQARSVAAKTLDKAWRSKTMVPACPYCKSPMFPEDFKSGLSMMGRTTQKQGAIVRPQNDVAAAPKASSDLP